MTVKYHSAPTVSAHRFSLEAFKFIADHPFVFVHCHVIVCNATDSSSKCGKKCSPSGRGRREVSSHMTDGVYMLAQGPIHLGHQKRDTNEGGMGQSGERLGTSFKRRITGPDELEQAPLLCILIMALIIVGVFRPSNYQYPNCCT